MQLQEVFLNNNSS